MFKKKFYNKKQDYKSSKSKSIIKNNSLIDNKLKSEVIKSIKFDNYRVPFSKSIGLCYVVYLLNKYWDNELTDEDDCITSDSN